MYIYIFMLLRMYLGATGWRSWLRYRVTNQKVAVSIPDGISGTFYLLNHSGLTMTLGSTQPLTEMSIKDLLWRVKAAGA